MLNKFLPLIIVVFALGACSTVMEEKDTDKDERLITGEREPITGKAQGERRDMGKTQTRARVEQGQVGPATQKALEQKVGARVYFGTDKHSLSDEARQTLRQQARWLERHPGIDVVIEGHTDERGTREYNLALGARRANSVRNFLIALGISADRIETVSYGKERPAVMGSKPQAWAKNRRAVTVVQ